GRHSCQSLPNDDNAGQCVPRRPCAAWTDCLAPPATRPRPARGRTAGERRGMTLPSYTAGSSPPARRFHLRRTFAADVPPTETPGLLHEVLEALAPYPEAREAVARALGGQEKNGAESATAGA